MAKALIPRKVLDAIVVYQREAGGPEAGEQLLTALNEAWPQFERDPEVTLEPGSRFDDTGRFLHPLAVHAERGAVIVQLGVYPARIDYGQALPSQEQILNALKEREFEFIDTDRDESWIVEPIAVEIFADPA